jgi:aspartyl-tRNA(Asn)/glutamyl-tRNA(Gln) amidotransferase subunit A
MTGSPTPNHITRDTDECLARIEREGQTLDAFSAVMTDEARHDARTAQERLARGGPARLLEGLLVGIKDIIDVAGQPTRAGSLTRKDIAPARRDAPVVARLRQAGAIFPVKTNTVEYAFGGWGTNLTIGTPRNPWDPHVHRVPGGSSSGSGVAVGAGLLPAALGTDTGGSVRIPAAFCGCVGLKTSIGLVSRAGVVPLSDTLDTVGPLAADVPTAARMFQVMQGSDPDDPSTAAFRPIDALGGLERGVGGLRIGCTRAGDIPNLDPDVDASCTRALGLLADAGATIVPFAPPEPYAELSRRSGFISAVEGYAHYRDLVEDPASGLAPPIRARMMAGRSISAPDFVLGQRQRRKAIDAFLSALDRLDALIMPALPIPAIPVAEVDETSQLLAPTTRFVNYLELASLAVPSGLSRHGLPVAIQIIVRRFDDALALRIGRTFELARGPFPRPPRA